MPIVEEDIQMLSSALRTIKPPSGMEQRVLAICACFARIQRMSSWTRLKPTWLKNLTDPQHKNFME